jgi:3-phosphoshikimate 1-carboxyvinyltransferase
MLNSIKINNKIDNFNKTITVPGDKSLSIRWVLFSSMAKGESKAFNLLLSEDVLAAIDAIKKLGIDVKLKKNYFSIFGKGLGRYNYKKNITINARNSGTLGRLIMGILIDTPYKIKIIGDKSLSKRDFSRIADPLCKFGAKIKLTNKSLPLTIKGTKNLSPINYLEKKGSAQCKSSVIFAGLKTEGTTKIKAKKSRNHTELLSKYLGLPVKVKKIKNYDLIEVNKAKKIRPLNYKIPSDISSGAFFIVLTALMDNSKLLIRNVNINPSRVGIITILKKMGVKIVIKNQKNYKGELIADIFVKSSKKLKAINCPSKLNSKAIDEFLIIFLVAAKAHGISHFKDISELNQKESPRLKWGSKILNKMGVKTITTNNSIKIFGNPNLKINKKIVIKNYRKDHRIFMTSVIAALALGGNWNIHDKDSINTSFPNYLKIINDLAKYPLKSIKNR